MSQLLLLLSLLLLLLLLLLLSQMLVLLLTSKSSFIEPLNTTVLKKFQSSFIIVSAVVIFGVVVFVVVVVFVATSPAFSNQSKKMVLKSTYKTISSSSSSSLKFFRHKLIKIFKLIYFFALPLLNKSGSVKIWRFAFLKWYPFKPSALRSSSYLATQPWVLTRVLTFFNDIIRFWAAVNTFHSMLFLWMLTKLRITILFLLFKGPSQALNFFIWSFP